MGLLYSKTFENYFVDNSEIDRVSGVSNIKYLRPKIIAKLLWVNEKNKLARYSYEVHKTHEYLPHFLEI